ncbi:unnamed protein product [Acanthoscelides obtectus]|uniref:Zinc finger PHD-type domain-containing protein n=1 Tax=Acanthoscelides obtectus TaxID=200917 RepID=A0A9P0KL76_ACAOB|nr:unnamed protein product [Acanthoscelides obtectus]CAK1661673.1 hypothetical protein AOBTE_LOCUS22738 [Acanthoscelides obtectus]
MKKTTEAAAGRGRVSSRGRRNFRSNAKVPRRAPSPSSSSSSDSDEDVLPSSGDDSDVDESLQGAVSENNDATCIFCDRRFSDDRKGEIWVQCQSCAMWAHNECSGAEREYYICDFCR